MSAPARDMVSPIDAKLHAAASDPVADYWDAVAVEWSTRAVPRAWRLVSDAVNLRLMHRWLRPDGSGSVLKTDLFDEATGTGLVPWLSASFASVTGVDISSILVDRARTRFPRLSFERADVRRLPFPTGAFDTVVSNSTLDHLATVADIGVALVELHRVTRPGGRLLITLDNPLNPVVAIRNALPRRMRTASGLVPFAIGATCGPRRLRALLRQAGFEVERTSAVFHAPRILVVLSGNVVGRLGNASAQRHYATSWSAFEGLGALPTRYLTGHFVVALARKA